MAKVILSADNRFKLSSSSKGDQVKWFTDNKYYKADTRGYEGISEALVGEFFKYIKGLDFVDYFLCEISEEDKSYFGCYSENFLRKGESLVSVYRILERTSRSVNNDLKKLNGKDLLSYVIDSVRDYTSLDITDYLGTISYLDCITMNEDRHFNNICLKVNKDSVFSLSPIFDNGLSLLSDVKDYPLEGSIGKMMNLVKCKPFSTNFMKQCSYFDRDPLIIDVKSFCKDLKYKTVDFKLEEYNRALTVLLKRLKQTEGIIWEQGC